MNLRSKIDEKIIQPVKSATLIAWSALILAAVALVIAVAR